MPVRLLIITENLFFTAKVQAVGKTTEATIDACASVDTARIQPETRAVLVDLNGAQGDVVAFAIRCKGDAQTRDIPLIGFYSHMQTELEQRARAAGYDFVWPRSVFVKRLAELARGTPIGT